MQERRGSRTRRQPPARQAHRYGFDRGRHRRIMAPHIYESTRVAERHGCVVGSGMRFLGGSEACVHHCLGLDGWRYCLSHCRVDPAHSLSQASSAGRNLITLFQGVNCFTKFFFAALTEAVGRSPIAARHLTRAFDDRDRARFFASKKNTYKTRRFYFSHRHRRHCAWSLSACSATSPSRLGVLNAS